MAILLIDMLRQWRNILAMVFDWVVARDRILLLDIYAKNEKDDLSAAELKVLRTLIEDY